MSQHIKVLVVAFCILMGVVFFFANPLNQSAKPIENTLFGFKKSDVASFEISNFILGLRFRREGDFWWVSHFRTELSRSLENRDNAFHVADVDSDNAVGSQADPVKIASLLTQIETARIEQPIASEKKSQSLFQINEHSLSVSFFDKSGSSLGRLYVGKEGPDFMSSYVKRNQENDVYLLAQNLQGLLRMPFEQWVYKDPVTSSDNSSAKTKQP